ncbi:MAG: MarR family transcriptional regulator [Dehalococcoidia bacterium]|nr:MarR family transcriptional regulator [Dehalococcoidia bacterium]
MKANVEAESTVLKLWRQVYQTYTLLKKTEDQIFEEYGLTTEQYGVLVAIDYFGGPTKVTDIARWLERSTNSVSMIVDRMVKAGLVRRARSTGDRRVVHVVNTSKGKTALKPATLASLEVIQKIMSPLSYEDRSTLLSLLGTIKYEILEYLNPGMDIQEIKRTEFKQAANVKKWLNEYGLPSTPEAKRQGRKKRKTT